MTELRIALCIACLLVAPLACAGLALVNTGLGRSRNAAHSMLSAVCAMATACCVYFAWGRAWAGSAEEASRVFLARAHAWDWIGAAPLFFAGIPPTDAGVFLTGWFGLVGVSLAALIPLGSGAERWRLGSVCASSAVLAGFTFPLFFHWTWGGGWLTSFGGYVDAGGSGSIHAVGGLTALTVAWIVGARRGKFTGDGIPVAMPGHNVVYVLFGCLLAGAGWVGLNAAGAVLFYGAGMERIPRIAVDTMLGAASAGLTAAAITRIRFGRPDASLTANGWMGGLVATAAGCAHMPPAAAMLTGMVAGALVPFSVELLELRLGVDDPGGSVSVHAVCGIWGLLAAGLFGRLAGNTGVQTMPQVVGIATLLGFVLPFAYGAHALLNRLSPMRVAREGERQGMDLYELGAGAYPDFVTHSDDFMQR